MLLLEGGSLEVVEGSGNFEEFGILGVAISLVTLLSFGSPQRMGQVPLARINNIESSRQSPLWYDCSIAIVKVFSTSVEDDPLSKQQHRCLTC